MIQLINKTNFQSNLFPNVDQNDNELLTCVIKTGYSFNLSGELSPLKDIEPIHIQDKYLEDDPQNHSLIAAEESMPYKQGGEIILYGTAYPYPGECRMTEVCLNIQKDSRYLCQKKLTVFGERQWQTGLMGISISKPVLLKPLPIRYEYAYGGADKSNPEKYYLYNPIGQGFCANQWHLNGVALPQIEQGPKFIQKPDHQPMPAGFGPLSRIHHPRINNFDKSIWPKQQYPKDIHNAAPIDQRIDEAFNGNEVIGLSGFWNEIPVTQEIKIKLKKLAINASLIYADKISALEPMIDTIVIDTDKKTLNLIARYSFTGELLESSATILLNQSDK